MAVTDSYTSLKTKEKDEMFIELFDLKDRESAIKKRIKEIEAIYKEDTIGLKEDKFFETSSGIKFSFRTSQRKGNIDAVALENAGINVDNYRKSPTNIVTLRRDK